jgi:hypothetical protein
MGTGKNRGADTVKVHEVVGEVKPEDHETGGESHTSSESESESEADDTPPKRDTMMETLSPTTADGDTTSDSEEENQANKKKPKVSLCASFF